MTDPLASVMSAGSWNWQDKNERYSKTVARKLLLAMGLQPMDVSSIVKMAGEGFGLNWLNTEYLDSRLAVDCRKVDVALPLRQMLRGGVTKTSHFIAWEEARQNWPGRDVVALVFDRRGDDLPDMVWHNSSLFDPDTDEDEWVMRFVVKGEPFTVQPLSGFLRRFSGRFRIA